MKSNISIGTALALPLHACAATPVHTTLEQSRQSRTRALIMSCCRHHEGLRMVHGDAEILIACRQWARARVR